MYVSFTTTDTSVFFFNLPMCVCVDHVFFLYVPRSKECLLIIQCNILYNTRIGSVVMFYMDYRHHNGYGK